MQHEEALEAYQVAREALEALPGATPRELGLLLGSWGDVHVRLKQLPEARALVLESMDLLKNDKDDHHSRGFNFTLLGVICQMEEDHARAVDFFELARKEHVGKSLEMANLLHVMACSYEKLGHFERATKLADDAHALLLQNVGPNHGDYASSLINLIPNRIRMKQLACAAEMAREAFEVRVKIYGSDNAMTQLALDWAECLEECDDPDDCELYEDFPLLDYRMCNACSMISKPAPKTPMDECPFCCVYFICCPTCPNAAKFGMDGHLVVCPKAPDVLPGAEGKCRGCGKSDGKLKWCNACKSIKYCSVKCQRSDWKRHRTPCREKKKNKLKWKV